MNQYITAEIRDGVGRISLNRPDKRNALKRDFIEEMAAAVQTFSNDDSLRMLVLASHGSVFCAGMDLGEMQERAQSEDGKKEWQRDSEVYCELLLAIRNLSVPTLAVVQGPVLAGGVGLVAACDMVLASREMFFMLPEPMRGITAAMVTPLLIHRVGTGPATYMLLSNERVSAEQAMTFGLCHAVVQVDKLEERAQQLVDAVLTGSKSALAITKKHIDDCTLANLDDQVKMSIGVSAMARETDDAREGLAAFLEKRKPNWQPANG